MYGNSIHILAPFAGLAVNVLVQVSVFRCFPKAGLLRSVFAGFASGFLAALPAMRGDTLVSSILTYALLGYCYFHFVNMGETARRIRILIELAGSKEGLSQAEILERYGSKKIVDLRLGRLVETGQVVCRDKKYYIGSPVMLAAAKTVAAAKRIIFGKMR